MPAASCAAAGGGPAATGNGLVDGLVELTRSVAAMPAAVSRALQTSLAVSDGQTIFLLLLVQLLLLAALLSLRRGAGAAPQTILSLALRFAYFVGVFVVSVAIECRNCRTRLSMLGTSSSVSFSTRWKTGQD